MRRCERRSLFGMYPCITGQVPHLLVDRSLSWTLIIPQRCYQIRWVTMGRFNGVPVDIDGAISVAISFWSSS